MLRSAQISFSHQCKCLFSLSPKRKVCLVFTCSSFAYCDRLHACAREVFSTRLFHIFPHAVPTAPPVTPSGSPITSTLITLRWDPIPAEHLNGILRFYLVDVTEVITNNSWTFHSVQRHVNIGPLHPYYTYRCRVAGFTVGVGPYTALFYVNSGEACEFRAECRLWRCLKHNNSIILEKLVSLKHY